MTDRDRSVVETVDAGTHEYTILKDSSSGLWDVELRGPAGSYRIRALTDISFARAAAAVAPAPVPELDGASFVAGRDESDAWHVFAAAAPDASTLEFKRLYALSELSALSPIDHFPLPDIRIVARDETQSSFESAVTGVFGRVITTYGVNLSDDSYYDKTLYFLENEAEIIDDEAGMDALAALAGYDSYTQFQYDDAGDPAISASSYEIDKMDWIEVIALPPQTVVDFVLDPSEKSRDDMLKQIFQAYRESGMPEVVFEGGRRTAAEIRAAASSTDTRPSV